MSSAYVTSPDITKTVTPDLKLGGKGGVLLHIDIGKGKRRLVGSALAQAFGQIGDKCPDLDDVRYLKTVFGSIQKLIADEVISAGHDISDGGILTTVLEMAFTGNCGLCLDLESGGKSLFQTLFAEELGLLVEVSPENLDAVLHRLNTDGLTTNIIGRVESEPSMELKVDGMSQLNEKAWSLRHIWEETSFELEKLQRLASSVDQQREGLKLRREPSWRLSFDPAPTAGKSLTVETQLRVAILR